MVEQSVELQSSYSLADQIVFKQQILEAMKFQAPVEAIRQGIDKFTKSGTSDGLRNIGIRQAVAASRIDDRKP